MALPSNSKKKSNKKTSFVSASIREKSRPIQETAAQKKRIADFEAAKKKSPEYDGIPRYIRKVKDYKSGSVSAGMFGLGKNSPLTKTSLATNPKRALDSKEWEMAVEGATGISSKNSAGANAALAAMAFLPVPGLKNIGAVARAGAKAATVGSKAAATGGKAATTGAKAAAAGSKVVKPAVTNGKSAIPVAKLSKTEARDMELADIKRLMMPDPRPAKFTAKFSADDGIRQAMRGKSGKALTTGPKPVRSGFRSDSAFKTAMKKWESKLEANRAAVRGGGDSLPVAPKATPVVKKPSVKKPIAPPKSLAARTPKPSTALAVRPGSTVATRPGAPAASTASKAVVTERGVPTFSYARPTTNGGRAQLAIEGPKTLVKRPAVSAGRAQLAIEGPKVANKVAKGGLSKKKKAAIGAAGATGLLFAGGEVLKRLDSKGSKTTASAAGTEGTKRQVLTDKYGRQIGRAEYNRREKYRASIVGKTPKQVERMRQAEAKRRLEFRRTDGKKQFGALASKKSKNLNVPVGVSVRKKRQGPVSPQNIRDRERFK